MKKGDIKAIAKEVAKMLLQDKTPVVEKDSKGRRKRPVMKDDTFCLYCNKADLDEFRKICKSAHKNMSSVIRQKGIYPVLKESGVILKDEG